MKKVNPFVLIEQYFYEDEEYSFWVDEDGLEDFKESFSELLEAGMKCTRERTIKGVDYNKELVGSIMDELDSEIVDEDCLECGHLLMKNLNFRGRKCSHCDFHDDDFKLELEKLNKETENLQGKSDAPKFRVPGETLGQFLKRNNMSLKDDGKNECSRCKKKFDQPTDFYHQKDMAVISWGHENCTNSGPMIVRVTGDLKAGFEKVLSTFNEE